MSRAPAAIPGRDRLLILLFWLAYVVAGSTTTIVTDGARDLIAAWDIAQGVEFPLRGPELYATWHLGPLWYYLLALPLLLTHSAALAAVMVAMLAGLKLPLAYRLGYRFDGVALARLGLIAIALPGWWMFQWLVTSHTNLAATCLLAYALLLLQWSRNGSGLKLAGAALMFSLALHAHPTCLFWIVLLVPAFLHRRRHGGVRSAQLLAALAVCVLPFAPMLWDEMRHGWPMLEGTRTFVAGRSDLSAWTRLPEFLRDLLVLDGTRVPGQFIASGSIWTSLSTLLQWALVGAAVIGLGLGSAPHRRTAWLAALACVCASLFVLMLRPEIPYWMVYSLMPVVAAVLAFGWWRLYVSVASSAWRWSLLSLWMLAGLSFLAMAMLRVQSAQEGAVSTPYRIVGAYAFPDRLIATGVPNANFPVIAQDRFVRWLCAQDQTIGLHGDVAGLQRLSQGSQRALHCADDRHWKIGGSDGEPVAMYAAFALRRAGIKSESSFGPMQRVPVQKVLRAAVAQDDDLVRAYPPWPLSQQATVDLNVLIPAGYGLIAVSNLRPVFNGLDPPILTVDGNIVEPLARSAVTWFFRAAAGHGGDLDIKTGNPDLIEVVALIDANPAAP